MAVNAGEVSVALALEDADFRAGLAAAQTSLEQFARELSALTVPPDVGADLAGLNLDLSAQFAAAGAQAGAAFASAIAASAPSAAAAGGGLAGAAASAARAGMSGASGIGRNFASGLASGIRAGRSGVVNAAASVARAAAAAARSALAIHSPSRVTEKFGEFFDLGFIRGVERLAPEIEDSVRAAVRMEQIAPEIEDSVRAAVRVEPPAGAAYGAAAAPAVQVRGPAIDYDRLAEAMDKRQIIFTMNDRRVAEAMSTATARAQVERSRSIALGYGKR